MINMFLRKPLMGWNSWNTFRDEISEELIMQVADEMVSGGYRDAGYQYVIIDDCWALKDRNENGEMVADPKKFPHGMKYLSDYIHEKGLKFGMYSCAGLKTCAGFPGSYGNEYIDAQTFANWGVDYLKYDYCHFPQSGNVQQAYHTMSMALKATGRDIVFSACNWGQGEPGTWMRSIGADMYRSTGDIFDNFESVKKIFEIQREHIQEGAIGCFNDMDMLVVGINGNGLASGVGGCTEDEYKTHFSLWCLLGSPLIIGADIRKIDEFGRNLLLNNELIAINQDSEVRPPFEVRTFSEDTRAFIKHVSDNEFIMAYYNFRDEDNEVQIYFADIGVPTYSGYCFELTDIFSGECISGVRDYYTPIIPKHGCKLYRARLVKR